MGLGVKDSGRIRQNAILEFQYSVVKDRTEMKIHSDDKDLVNEDNSKKVDFKQLCISDVKSRLEHIIEIASKTIKDESKMNDYASSIRFLERIIEENYRSSEPMYIYPAPNNNLEFEWASNSFVLVLDVMTMKAEFIGNCDAEDFKIDMGERESWNRLCSLIDGERNHDVLSLHLIN